MLSTTPFEFGISGFLPVFLTAQHGIDLHAQQIEIPFPGKPEKLTFVWITQSSYLEINSLYIREYVDCRVFQNTQSQIRKSETWAHEEFSKLILDFASRYCRKFFVAGFRFKSSGAERRRIKKENSRILRTIQTPPSAPPFYYSRSGIQRLISWNPILHESLSYMPRVSVFTRLFLNCFTFVFAKETQIEELNLFSI